MFPRYTYLGEMSRQSTVRGDSVFHHGIVLGGRLLPSGRVERPPRREPYTSRVNLEGSARRRSHRKRACRPIPRGRLDRGAPRVRRFSPPSPDRIRYSPDDCRARRQTLRAARGIRSGFRALPLQRVDTPARQFRAGSGMRRPVDEKRVRDFLHALAMSSELEARVYLTGRNRRTLWLASDHSRPGLEDRAGQRLDPPGDPASERRARNQRGAGLAGRFHPGAARLAGPEPIHRARKANLLSSLRSLRAGSGQDRARSRKRPPGREGDAPKRPHRCGRLRELYEAIEPRLFRYPAINPKSFRRALENFLAEGPREGHQE